VRSDPRIGGAQIGSILPGAVVQLLDKPACANNIVWWKVSTDNGQKGWTAEGSGPNNYFLIPLLGQ